MIGAIKAIAKVFLISLTINSGRRCEFFALEYNNDFFNMWLGRYAFVLLCCGGVQ